MAAHVSLMQFEMYFFSTCSKVIGQAGGGRIFIFFVFFSDTLHSDSVK